jgi:hypothetical protein
MAMQQHAACKRQHRKRPVIAIGDASAKHNK